jgi:hypothetical protein
MTRDELIREFRVLTQDGVEPYLFDTAWITRWLSEAEIEAAVRGRLLHESSNPSICEIDVSPGTSSYPLHESLYEIDHLGFREQGSSERCPVRLTSTEELDRTVIDWRDCTGRVRYAIQTDTSIRLVPTPERAGTLYLEGYRLPITGIDAVGKPEIHPAHHRHLLDWALHRAYSLPDSETINLGKAAEAENTFTRYFGVRPDSDLRRITREDATHYNKVFMP